MYSALVAEDVRMPCHVDYQTGSKLTTFPSHNFAANSTCVVDFVDTWQ